MYRLMEKKQAQTSDRMWPVERGRRLSDVT